MYSMESSTTSRVCIPQCAFNFISANIDQWRDALDFLEFDFLPAVFVVAPAFVSMTVIVGKYSCRLLELFPIC